MTSRLSEADRRQWAMLVDASTEPGSGMMRYAAAMHLHLSGQLGSETLELYRALAKQDDAVHPGRDEQIIRRLTVEIGDYLDRISPNGFPEVRSGIANVAAGRVGTFDPKHLPACNLIVPALNTCGDPIAAAIHQAAPLLHWSTYDAYPIEEIGKPFARGHAFASIVGGHAPLLAEDFDLGLFVIAPKTLYRDHRHAAPELYMPLTGPHRWRFSPGGSFVEREAHVPVWNESFAPHATLTGETPFLSLYCWTNDVNQTASVVYAPDWSDYECASG